jgi:hypothetical protein
MFPGSGCVGPDHLQLAASGVDRYRPDTGIVLVGAGGAESGKTADRRVGDGAGGYPSGE